MSGLLDGKVALVTGSATGLGRAIVEQFAGEGATGIGLDRENQDSLPAGWGGVHGDVCKESDIAAAVTKVADDFGRLDIVVANAGVVPPWSETGQIGLDEWDQVFAVNVRGVIATIKHSIPLMKTRGGSVIAMGSLNSQRAHARQCLYTATKHAVLGIVRSTALDLGRFGIRVNALGPGPVATDALMSRLETRAANGEPSPDEMLAQFSADTALGRMATENDVARAAIFLASDLSGAMTGQILPIDAGLG